MGKRHWHCCHHDGYLHPWLFIILLLAGLSIVIYITVVLLRGLTGGPLSPLQVSVLIVVACGAVVLLLWLYYAPKERRKQEKQRFE